MGHLLHGTSLASASHVERYGFRTIRGNTGGVRVEALVKQSKLTATTAKAVGECIMWVDRIKGVGLYLNGTNLALYSIYTARVVY